MKKLITILLVSLSFSVVGQKSYTSNVSKDCLFTEDNADFEYCAMTEKMVYFDINAEETKINMTTEKSKDTFFIHEIKENEKMTSYFLTNDMGTKYLMTFQDKVISLYLEDLGRNYVFMFFNTEK